MVILEELKKMAKTKEIKTKTTEPKLVAYTVHKGSYSKLGETYQRLSQWIYQKGYEIVGPPTDIYYTNPMETPEEEWITEVQFPIKKREEPPRNV